MLGQGGAGVQIGDVERLEEDLLRVLRSFLAKLVDALRARAEIGRDDFVSGTSKVEADFCAEAADAAGHERDALSHFISPIQVRFRALRWCRIAASGAILGRLDGAVNRARRLRTCCPCPA